jgi:hypothetical protein
VTCDQIAKTPVFTGVFAVRSRLTQALGRFPWFAPFFLRARRLRPVLPIRSLLVTTAKSHSLSYHDGVMTTVRRVTVWLTVFRGAPDEQNYV